MLRIHRVWAGLVLLLALCLPVLADVTSAPVTPQKPVPLAEKPIVERFKAVGQAYLIGKRLHVDYDTRLIEDKEDGVVRITDWNYKDVVEKAPPEDVFVIIMHGDLTHRNSPQYFEAHNASVQLARASDSENLKHVKWGRMDYVDEWKQCARWLVFRPPQLIIITDSGRSLRFFSSRMFPANGEIIYNFIESGNWRNAPEWESVFAKNGSMAWIAEAYISPQEKLFNTVGHVPNFVYMLIFGGLTKIITGWMTNFFNSRGPEPAAQPARAPVSRNTTENVEKALKELRARREREAKAAKEKEKGDKAK